VGAFGWRSNVFVGHVIWVAFGRGAVFDVQYLSSIREVAGFTWASIAFQFVVRLRITSSFKLHLLILPYHLCIVRLRFAHILIPHHDAEDRCDIDLHHFQFRSVTH
jgi:hypothetical protein